ncbi:hypothetical protein BKA67DRAFT_661403 [Truncatella angustata]|uniref:Uncharacterized protein n=1 Tax=Truncatella angustata TaxID=152316 RepID=A0A9P8ZT96_9PEZI|nr:uncharacterized protein BKA67DRAFT_661403 [Truncatella angustata]KAH6648427.1 hypothetical protein BKA67DRAFT_661403 [Truncatella angustata]KAH8201552.1 hypothetical protein TruAng_004244 [Truncatella angustata]
MADDQITGAVVVCTGAENNDSSSCTEPRPFFAFPLEIRRMIYKNLLSCEGVITNLAATTFHTEIMRTCRQIHYEAHQVLYEENTWHFEINSSGWNPRYEEDFDIDEEIALFLRSGSGFETIYIKFGDYLKVSNHDYDLLAFNPCETDYGLRLEHIRRVQVTVKVKHVSEHNAACRAVVELVVSLQAILDLQHLEVFLEGPEKYVPGSQYYVLEPFRKLKDVGEVTFHGINHQYAEYLTRKMKGLGPVKSLPYMFKASQRLMKNACVSGIESCMRNAVREGDLQRFKELRTELVSETEKYRRHALDLLFEFDVDEQGAQEPGSWIVPKP